MTDPHSSVRVSDAERTTVQVRKKIEGSEMKKSEET
jgi:hypothetical protein